MAHAHDDLHTHREIEVVDRGTGVGAGLMVAIAALLVVAIIGLAVVWSRPWDNGSSPNTNPNPGISDNSGGGNNSGGGDQPAP